MRVSGTYLPPKRPKRPKESGRCRSLKEGRGAEGARGGDMVQKTRLGAARAVKKKRRSLKKGRSLMTRGAIPEEEEQAGLRIRVGKGERSEEEIACGALIAIAAVSSAPKQRILRAK
jgi:hypothetical protein